MFLNRAQKKQKLIVWSLIIISALSAYLIPLLKFQHTILNRDWSAFNSFSHFVHSCYLHYKTLPLHNPYLLGGMDMFADPQSKIFSPLAIFDILFKAPYANLLSLVSLSIVGGYGMYLLLRHLNIKIGIALSVVFIFQHATWFSMHYSEGHIIFGSFQLIGFVIYYTLRLHEPKYKLYMAALLGFMVIDGGMYAFIFSLLLIGFIIAFGTEGIVFKKLFMSFLKQWKISLLSAFVFLGLFCAKIIPLLSLHSNREPVLENIVLDFQSLVISFFYPLQYIILKIEGANYTTYRLGFHEVGAYFGVLSFILVIVFLIRHFKKRFLPWIFITVVFIWIGSGAGNLFNPWRVFQHIPLINNAHVQTRLLYFGYVGLLILLSFSLNQFLFTRVWVRVLLISVLLLESAFVGAYSWNKMFEDKESVEQPDVFDTLITHTKVDKTVRYAGEWGLNHHIFKQKNTAAIGFMAPAAVRGQLKHINSNDYRGEAYYLSGVGSLYVKQFTPQGLIVEIDSKTPAEVQFNTNYLGRWVVDNQEIKVLEKNGLLTLKIDRAFKGEVKLKYRPLYLYFVIPFYFLSLLLIMLYFKKNYTVKNKII